MIVVSIIFGAAFTVGVAFALGALLLRRLGLGWHRGEAALFAFLGGAACLSLGVFLLCLVHQARPAVFLAAGVAAIGSAAWQGREARRVHGITPREPLPQLQTEWQLILSVGLGAFFLLYFFNALAPEISPDGSGYHLGNVALYLRVRGFAWDHHSMYAYLSQGMEMLFLVAFAFGRHSAAALVHLAFQTVLPLLMVCYGRRFGCPRAGAFAALLVYASPVVGIDGISAYNDVAVATLAFAVFYLLQVWDEDQNPRLLILIGLLAGFAYGVKYTAGLVAPFAAVFVAWRGRKNRLRSLTTVSLAAALMIAPWTLRNWIWLGNPAAPFLNRWFPNAYYDAAMERQYVDALAHYPKVSHYFEIPVQLTVLGGLVPGMVGPVFLLAPLALLALRHRQGSRLLLAAVVLAVPAFWNTETRFLIPALPFVALAMGLGMANSRGVLPALAAFQAIACWPAVLSAYCDPGAWRLHSVPVRAALRIEPEAVFIARHIANYPLKGPIERTVPAGKKILAFAGHPDAYIEREFVVGYESLPGKRAQDTLLAPIGKAPADRRAAATELKGQGIDYLLVNDSDYIGEDLRTHTTGWGITELARLNGTVLYRID